MKTGFESQPLRHCFLQPFIKSSKTENPYNYRRQVTTVTVSYHQLSTVIKSHFLLILVLNWC